MASLPEADFWANEFRAPPPADEMVLVAWYNNAAQLTLALEESGFCYVRLGARSGALHVHPNLAKVRRIILRAKGGEVHRDILLLRAPGFSVITRNQLRDRLKKLPNGREVSKWVESPESEEDEENIYAFFQTKRDPDFVHQLPNGGKLMEKLEDFERDRRNGPKDESGTPLNLARTSPYPRILSLREVLRARVD